MAAFGFPRQNFLRREREFPVGDSAAILVRPAYATSDRVFPAEELFFDLAFALRLIRLVRCGTTRSFGAVFKQVSSVGVPFRIAVRFFSNQSPARSKSGPVGRGQAFKAAILSGIERDSSPKVA